MGKLTFDTGQKAIKQGKAFFTNIKSSFGLSKEILQNIPSDIVTISAEIDNVILYLDKLSNLLNSKKISNSDLVNKITKSQSFDLNKYFDNTIKSIIKYPIGKQIYQQKGFIKAVRYILSSWNNILNDINAEITKVSDQLANSDSKVNDYKLSTALYINIYSISPNIEFIGRSILTSICNILENVSKDEYDNLGKILVYYLEYQDVIFPIIFGDQKIVKSINTNINKRGLNYFIFSKDNNVFDFLKFSDLKSNVANLFRLSKMSRSIIGGDYYINRKIKKGEKLNNKKEYMEMRVLYLKNKLANNPNKDELEKIKYGIEYYENYLQKIDKQLNSLYL